MLKALLVHLVMGRDDALVMDMEAGIEHLGRATAQSMDGLLLVVDAGPWSVQTALRVRKLAADLGMSKLFAVANRVADGADMGRIAEGLDGIPLIGRVSFDEGLAAGVGQAADGTFRPSEAFARRLPQVREILDQLRRRL